MKRLVTVFFMAIFAMFTSLSGSYAQTSTGWTLNINPTMSNSVPAGTEIEFSAVVNNSGNYSTTPTTVTFTLPKTVKFLGFSVDDKIFNACTSTLPIDEELTADTTITCEVRSLEPQEGVEAKIRLSPMVEGTVKFGGKIEGNGAEQSRTITVTKGADLGVSLTSPKEVIGGGKLNFTATVENKGPYAAEKSSLTFPVPVGVVLDQALPNGCILTNNTVTCEITQKIEPGEKLSFNFQDR